MPSCVVKFCRNNSTHQTKSLGVTFHRFPPETDWKEKWIKALRDNRREEEWTPSKFSVVCSLHFLECDTYMTKGGYRKIKKDAAPKKMFLKDSEWLDKIEKPPVEHTCIHEDIQENIQECVSRKDTQKDIQIEQEKDSILPDLDIEEIDLISAEWCQEMEELGITTESLSALLDECYSDIENEFDDIDTQEPNTIGEQKSDPDPHENKECDCKKKRKKLRKKRTLQELRERFKVSYKIRVKKSKLQLLREKLTALKRTMRR